MPTIESYPRLLTSMAERYSCRSFDMGRGADRDLIAAALDAARIAPSAVNRQPWLFLVVDSPEAREAVCASYGREWIKTAPAFIIALADHSQSWVRPDGKDHADIDMGIAVEHLCLAATSLGLGTCWVCNFDPQIIRDAFSVPEHLEPVAIIPIGYPAPDCPIPNRGRKNLDEIVRWGAL